jgi:hypothetical protein
VAGRRSNFIDLGDRFTPRCVPSISGGSAAKDPARETLSHPMGRMVAQIQSAGCTGDQEMEHEEKQPAKLDSGIWTLWLKCW